MAEPDGRMAAALDEVDLKLIAELKKDGRASMRTLAERVHISRAGCYTRVERLHREGVITGYTAVTDPRRLGQGLAAYVYLKVTQNTWRSVSADLKGIPEIEHGGLVSGDNDLILFVRTRDADSLRDLVFERLQAMPHVLSTHTVLVFDEL